MKKFIYLLTVILALTTSGCLDIIEEITLKKDGSGTYALTFDMQKLMGDGMMRDMIKGMMEEEGGDMSALGQTMATDTVIYMKDLPAEQKAQLDKPAFWDKVHMKMTMSEKKNQYFTSFVLDFDDVSDIAYMLENMDKIGGSGAASGMMDNQGLPTGGFYELSKKTLTRTSAKRTQNADMQSEEMAMMKMMMSGATYKTIYNFPGKVKKTNIQGAKIDGKTLTVTHDMLDLMENKVSLDGMIKFKK